MAKTPKAGTTGFMVYSTHGPLLDAITYHTAVEIEGKWVELSARPALAIYETYDAAKVRAHNQHEMGEPAFIAKVSIKKIGFA